MANGRRALCQCAADLSSVVRGKPLIFGQATQVAVLKFAAQSWFAESDGCPEISSPQLFLQNDGCPENMLPQNDGCPENMLKLCRRIRLELVSVST